MRCPKCGEYNNCRVLKTVGSDEGTARKLMCLSCEHTFISIEVNPLSLINKADAQDILKHSMQEKCADVAPSETPQDI